MSNYQRLRIEHVCTRLGLFSLSYLWQQPQLPLLDLMIASGMEVVLVKVAGVGLGVDLVGKSIREVRPLLARLVRALSFWVLYHPSPSLRDGGAATWLVLHRQ